MAYNVCVTTRRGRMPVASTLRQGAVALRTRGIYCVHMYSEVSLSRAAAVVQELWRRRAWQGAERACTWQQAGIREVMGEKECWTNTLNSGHTFNPLTPIVANSHHTACIQPAAEIAHAFTKCRFVYIQYVPRNLNNCK